MGNQASRVIHKKKERTKKIKQTRRRKHSGVSSEDRSHFSGTVSQASSAYSHGDYDWLEGTHTRARPTISSSNSTETSIIGNGSIKASSRITTVTSSSSTHRSTEAVLDLGNGLPYPMVRGHEEHREQDRLQRQHYLLKNARKANAVTSIPDHSMIVDVGTGNGIWAWEMANEFPSCQVVGIDRRKPSEQISRCSNLSYIEASIFEPWPLADNSVHFIFQRNMGQDIPKEKWRFILTEMHRVLRSGGEIELLEPDLWHHNPGPVQQAFDKFFQDLCIEMSINFTFTESLQQDIQEVGFQNVQQHSLDIPIGEWPQDPELKQFGFMNKEIRKSFLKNRKPFYTSKWGFTSDKFDIVLQELMDEYDEYHGFSRFNCWTAKKVM